MEKRKSWRAEDLDVFTRAYELSLQLHRASLDFPKIEQYAGLADQLRRASKSVCGLIVEGSGRQAASPKEFARDLMMAVRLGGGNEAVALLRARSGISAVRAGRTLARGSRTCDPDAARTEGKPRSEARTL